MQDNHEFFHCDVLLARSLVRHELYLVSFSDVETDPNDAIRSVVTNQTIHALHSDFGCSLQATMSFARHMANS